MKAYVQVHTTTEKKEDAEKIATILVQKKLAACVQLVGPIDSTYWWRGEVETSQEWLCLAKSTQSLFSEIQEAIKAEHPYELPEIIATPIVAGDKDYLKWLEGEVKRPS